jgi:hypothetical protein
MRRITPIPFQLFESLYILCIISFTQKSIFANSFCTSEKCLSCTNSAFTTYQKQMCFSNWFGALVSNDTSQFIPANCASVALKNKKYIFECNYVIYAPSTSKFNMKVPKTNTLTYEQLKERTHENFFQCTNACDGGCYHTALATHLKEFQRLGIAITTVQVQQLCTDLIEHSAEAYGRRPSLYIYCYTGLGHGMLWESGEDKIKAVTTLDLTTALSVCNGISSKSYSKYCRIGLYKQFWFNQMAVIRSGKSGMSLKEIQPQLANIMANTCHSQAELQGAECGEFWSYGVKLETNHSRDIGAKICTSAAKIYKNISSSDDADIHEAKVDCWYALLESNPKEASVSDYCPSHCCGILCEQDNCPPAATTPPATTPPATTPPATTTAAPIHVQDISEETWQSVMIATAVSGISVMFIIMLSGALWNWKLRHITYGALHEVHNDEVNDEEEDDEEEGDNLSDYPSEQNKNDVIANTVVSEIEMGCKVSNSIN